MSWLLQGGIGILVGLYSYLSPGIINIQVFQLSLHHAWRKVLFIIGIIAFVEIPYCMLCMSGFKWLMSIRYLQLFLSWGVFLMMFIMAIVMFYKTYTEIPKDETSVLPPKLMTIPSLLLFAILNPFQLSAWSIWGAYFVDKTWFSWTYTGIFFFSIGACIGAFLILFTYGHIGKRWMHFFTQHKKQLDYTIATLLLFLSMVQLLRNLNIVS
ncbi:MAG: LysE family transporter [Chitinophagaceae bacterium]|nr:LysE family transporter [Chitinophagaceae bacterium]